MAKERASQIRESGSGIMTSVSEAAFLIRQVAEPRPVGDTIKAAIGRAALRLRWPFIRVKKIWYAEALRIDSEEMDELRRFARKQAAQFEIIADALEAKDAEFFGEHSAVYRSIARQIRGVDHA